MSAEYDRSIRTYLKTLLVAHRRTIALNLGNVTLRSLLFLVPPLMTKSILERWLPEHNMSMLLVISICIVVAPITGSAMIVFESHINKRFLALAGEGRSNLFNGIQHRPLSWLRDRRIGDLMTRILDDTEQLTSFSTGDLLFAVLLAISSIVGSGALLWLYPPLGIAIVVLWSVHTLLVARFGAYMKKKAAETSRQASAVTETVREVMTGAHFIKASGLEVYALETVSGCLEQEWQHTRRTMRGEQLVQLTNTCIHAGFLVLIYYWGGRAVLDGRLSIGGLAAFLAVYNWIRPFGLMLFQIYLTGKRSAPAAERIAEIAFAAAPAAGLVLPDRPHAITARQVSFHYDGRPILQGIDLYLAPGSVTALIGRRGSGKSTLADILLGLTDPSSGTVLIDDVPLSRLDNGWLRSRLIGITQDVQLRSGTVLDNIAYGLEHVDPTAIDRAVRLAELDGWIARLPDGLHTVVGEQGLSLSGGERQRISIARALLRSPSILVLDEATSALDPATEQRLLHNLIHQLRGTTLLFITHRPAVTSYCDQVIVLENGAIRHAKEELRA